MCIDRTGSAGSAGSEVSADENSQFSVAFLSFPGWEAVAKLGPPIVQLHHPWCLLMKYELI